MRDPNIFTEPVGLLKKGTIVEHNDNQAKVRLNINPSTSSIRDNIVSAYFPITLANQKFIGSKMPVGTPVILGQGAGNEYFIVGLLPDRNIPELKDDEVLIQSGKNSKISLTKNEILIGKDFYNIKLNTNNNTLTSRLNFQQTISKYKRQFEGVVKRDSILYPKLELNSRIDNELYDDKYSVICLDPTLNNNPIPFSINKNPAIIESREVIYEFEDDAQIHDDINESLIYSSGGLKIPKYTLPNRKKSKADTLNLNFYNPNYLIESIKGTVVDIFGNILDINRAPLPLGQDDLTLNPEISQDRVQSFNKIKDLHRKGIAFHWELNSKKDFEENKSSLFNFSSFFPDNNYGRIRSNFSLDIDKEGQFKLNVPASSSKGNIPLLTRYENFSNISDEDLNNPNKLIYREDSLDLLLESFACPKFDLETFEFSDTPGSIEIKNNNVINTPLDRRFEDPTPILHGTAYHDILATCFLHQEKGKKILSQYPIFKTDTEIPVLENIITPIINIDDDFQGGGRSGSINFDGSIEMNIGANTIDRQSLWLDTAGGIIANIGRDRFNKSAAISMNGDVFVQIGGYGVIGDTRFVKQQNGVIGSVFDLRILHDGATATMLRIDNSGISILTPGNLDINANGNISITGAQLEIDVENCVIQGRAVKKELAGSI